MPVYADEFFNKYAEAYESGDAQKVAERYFTPSVIMSDDSKLVFSTLEMLHDHFEVLLEKLERIGASSFEPEVCQTMRLSDTIIFATVRWYFYDEDQCQLFSSYVSYTLQHVEDDLRIVVSVTDDEDRQLGELLEMT